MIPTVAAVLSASCCCDMDLELVVDTFFADDTWTWPSGVTSITVDGWAAGGDDNASNDGGGGGSAYARIDDYAGIVGRDYDIEVGSPVSNGDGEHTSFTDSVTSAELLYVDPGKSYASGQGGGEASSCTGDVAYDGGDGSGTFGGGSAGDTSAGAAHVAGTHNGATGGTANSQNLEMGAGSYAADTTTAGPGELRVKYRLAPASDHPYVVDRAYTRKVSSGTSHVITIPSDYVEAGDLLIAVFCATGDYAASASGSWEELGKQTAAFSAYRTSVFGLVATGSDTLTITTTSSSYSTCLVYAIRGGAGLESVFLKGTGSSGAWNTAEIDLGVSDDWLAISVAGGGATARCRTTAAPTSYGNVINIPQGSHISALPSFHSAERRVTATSVDPGAWSVTGTPNWAGFTILVGTKTTAEYLTALFDHWYDFSTDDDVTIGTNIESIADKIGSLDLSQTDNTSRQPVHQTGGPNSNKYAEFDGSDDILYNNSAAWTGQPFEVWSAQVACRATVAASRAAWDVFHDISTAFRSNILWIGSATSLSGWAGGFLPQSSTDATAWLVSGIHFNGASSRFELTSETTVTGDLGTGGTYGSGGSQAGICLGALWSDSAGDLWEKSNIGEFLMSETALTQDARDMIVRPYLEDKWT